MTDPATVLRRLNRPAPPRINLVRPVLNAVGSTIDPDPQANVHPLLAPIAETSGGMVGLLVWPTAETNDPVPVVRQGATGLHLLARSVDDWLHWQLAELDQLGHPDLESLSAQANEAGELYTPGALKASRLPVNAYVLVRTGGNHAFFESLANGHLERGDVDAALITADRGCRVGPGWARPLAFRADLLHQLGKPQQAADAARNALLEPVWTLGARFEPVAELAGWSTPIRKDAFRRLAEDETKLPADRAAHWMDAACAEELPYKDIRLKLADLYREATLPALADWIEAAS